MLKKKKIYFVYVLKYNANCQMQVILLMIPNKEGFSYLAIKKTINTIDRNNI